MPPAERTTDDLTLIERRMRELSATIGEFDPQRPIWITEVGYNAAVRLQDRAGQARFLASVAEVLDARPDVATLFWFKYEDYPPASGPNTQRWGVVTIPFAPSATARGGAAYELNAPIQIHPAFGTFQSLARR